MIKLNIKKSCSIVKTCIFNKRYYICCKLNYQTLYYRSLTYINERYFFRFDINFYSSTNCSGCQITGVLWLFFFLVMFFLSSIHFTYIFAPPFTPSLSFAKCLSQKILLHHLQQAHHSSSPRQPDSGTQSQV